MSLNLATNKFVSPSTSTMMWVRTFDQHVGSSLMFNPQVPGVSVIPLDAPFQNCVNYMWVKPDDLTLFATCLPTAYSYVPAVIASLPQQTVFRVVQTKVTVTASIQRNQLLIASDDAYLLPMLYARAPADLGAI